MSSYHSVHVALYRKLGKANEYPCAECSEPADEWALRIDAPDVQRDRFGAYSLRLDDYQPMCRHHHRIYDKAKITQCPKGHEYSGDNVYLDAGKRKCRTCVNARNAARRQANPLTIEQHQRRMEMQRHRRALEQQRSADVN